MLQLYGMQVTEVGWMMVQLNFPYPPMCVLLSPAAVPTMLPPAPTTVVTYDTTPPAPVGVTVEQAATQEDPTGSVAHSV